MQMANVPLTRIVLSNIANTIAPSVSFADEYVVIPHLLLTRVER